MDRKGFKKAVGSANLEISFRDYLVERNTLITLLQDRPSLRLCIGVSSLYNGLKTVATILIEATPLQLHSSLEEP